MEKGWKKDETPKKGWKKDEWSEKRMNGTLPWRRSYRELSLCGRLLSGTYPWACAAVAAETPEKDEIRMEVGLKKDEPIQKAGTSSAAEIDFLDVPTFMRKQVD